MLLSVTRSQPSAVLLELGALLRTNAPGIQKLLVGMVGAASTGTFSTLSQLASAGLVPIYSSLKPDWWIRPMPPFADE